MLPPQPQFLYIVMFPASVSYGLQGGELTKQWIISQNYSLESGERPAMETVSREGEREQGEVVHTPLIPVLRDEAGRSLN